MEEHCPLCSTFTQLYEVSPGVWVCKEGPEAFTCYAMTEKAINTPLPITIKDF